MNRPGARLLHPSLLPVATPTFSDRDWNDAVLTNAASDIHHDDPAFGYRFIGRYVLDGTDQRAGLVGGHLLGSSVLTQRSLEEPASGRKVAACGHEHVGHLAMLIDRSMDVPSDAGDLHVGLIEQPLVTERARARSSASISSR